MSDPVKRATSSVAILRQLERLRPRHAVVNTAPHIEVVRTVLSKSRITERDRGALLGAVIVLANEVEACQRSLRQMQSSVTAWRQRLLPRRASAPSAVRL